MKKIVFAVLVISALFGVLFWRFSGMLLQKEEGEDKNISLNYWGLGEDEAPFRPIIGSYQLQNPKVKITFARQSLLNYRTRLLTQLQAGQGPDIFLIHSSWLPMFSEDLSPAPGEILSTDEYTKLFYQIAKETLINGGKIYAVPKEIDGLALLYNEDILKAAGATVPVTWQEFLDVARRVTVKNTAGQIQTAGAAMGATANVDFWPEILALLFLQQPDGNLTEPANQSGSEVLQFYAGFVTDPKNKTWDVTLPSSSQMFSSGKLAFYFATAAKAASLKVENPNLNFKTAPVPQLPGGKISYGGFWAIAVSARSQNQKKAWEFVKYLSTPEVIQARSTTLPYPRQDMAGLQVGDPILGAYISQAAYFKGWYLNSDARDAGINDEMVKLYEGALNSVLQGGDSRGALQAIQPGIGQILDKYQASKK
ncbi:hypothetical protein A3A14_01365 [Candidatus Daviesbacteria bacterium RIFCSPLOWO2_01_FULL_43_38]|uniref:ABC transporter substrate-binding protein n=4 Tax=Candidatus Daviesiibacteriota TaxID=1752718 RepID=A0A1F5K7Y2_9BACT|nr:MAG: hypothetical protein A2874_02350 [Candidatus Daviesbacteria bacterium RIFCSPHIGHO2_01_FULL_43_17]OGE36880.1 MAG: hypothetical protein A3E45_03490 [Candidatus Daviesbacteria bacterium RIFCSPHIGHO2_12_FULL_43_11]OGE63306.1 MAG: hypothetical protein A3A14_01365 [Candidatus Daviesbacteria bacterium RIFCSPLOWO2_01_FULL_43_38]OGE70877.1 MAG: hypothetical protein A3J21_00125 [Candidatus Daviesbacteria bacterium RIFCSPLOWO2_02_FULL_43_11]